MNGIKVDNYWWNLEYVTRQENQEHAIFLKLKTDHGESSPNAKLTTVQVRAIRTGAARGITQRELGALHGIAQSVVGDIVRGRMWRFDGVLE
jgi:hypothetical protein